MGRLPVLLVLVVGCSPRTEPVPEERPPAAEPEVRPRVEPPPAVRAAPTPVRDDARALRVRQVEELMSAPRHRPKRLGSAAGSTRIVPGTYRCRISEEYRLRDCTVTRVGGGHVMLTIPSALLAVRGVLWDEGKTTHFEGWVTAERPFGCFRCPEECLVDPEACGCSELPIAGLRECLTQPIRFDLTGGPNKWTGTLEYRMFENVYEGSGAQRRVSRHSSRREPMEVTLQGPPRAGAG